MLIKKITLIILILLSLFSTIKISKIILVLINFIYPYTYIIAFFFILTNILYFITIILKKQEKFEESELKESLVMKKIKNNKMFLPHELIIDIINFLKNKNKNITLPKLASLTLIIIFFPLINIFLLGCLISFSINFLIYLNEILIAFIFNQNIILEGKTNEKLTLNNIFKILSFHFLYNLLENKGHLKKNIKNHFKNNIMTFFLSRLYGKSLLILKSYIFLYQILNKTFNQNYTRKKVYILPLILFLEFKDFINHDIVNYNLILIQTLKNKRIIIKNRKIRPNPSELAQKIIQLEGKNLDVYFTNEFLKMIKAKLPNQGFLDYKFNHNFKSIQVSNKIHLGYNFYNINEKNSLVQIFTSCEQIPIKRKNFMSHNQITSRYQEEVEQILKENEKYSTYAVVPKNKISENDCKFPLHILSDYTDNNPNLVPFFELQQKIQFSQKISRYDLKVFLHNEKGRPIKEINNNDLMKMLDSESKILMNKDHLIIHDIINSKIEQIIKNQQITISLQESNYLKAELVNYSYTLFTNLPSIEFQEKCLFQHIENISKNRDESVRYIQDLKKIDLI